MPKIIAVMSGKGGVGKSSVSVAIASIISEKYKTLILDFDICGPSITSILKISGSLIKTTNGFKPIKCSERLDVLSFGSILNPDDVVIWRGPKKLIFLELFFNSINEYEYVIIDMPPGISEEHEFVSSKDLSVIFVTTPQNISLNDTQRCIEYCISKNMNMIGLIENMASFKCECCNEIFYPFGSKGGQQLADEYDLNLLCKLPIEMNFSKLIDSDKFNDSFNLMDSYQIMKSMLYNFKIIE